MPEPQVKVTVNIEMELVDRLPPTPENLKNVTSVILIKASGNAGLLVESDPTLPGLSDEERDYKVINILERDPRQPDGPDIHKTSEDALRAIVKLMETITGEVFECIRDDQYDLVFRRRSFQIKIGEFERQRDKILN